ncbi:MAG: LysM peptidoglycan-binding domain-containing protein [Verrucomicrobiales bacterium]|jgi:nucleoid-associated protein YgaU|tara:strand:+ start:199 stop:657 length:459 start_codon:yes stop_codon:yes gene_type:complete
MNLRFCQIFLLLLTSVVFVGCSRSGREPHYNPEVGPFDEDGNYVEAWADNPPTRVAGIRKTQPTQKPRPVAKPRPITTAKVTPKPKPRPVVKPKPRPKPVVAKPKSIKHMIKRGDTLWGLSRRYGVSVTAIQKANRISGTNIRAGKTILIPK